MTTRQGTTRNGSWLPMSCRQDPHSCRGSLYIWFVEFSSRKKRMPTTLSFIQGVFTVEWTQLYVKWNPWTMALIGGAGVASFYGSNISRIPNNG